jgi:hypothetical protein
MKLNASRVTSSQPPKVAIMTRFVSVRGARPISTSAATIRASAAGMSHEI